jgi:hypothetical protein
MAEKKKYNSILVSGRKDETLTYTKYIKDEESGESVKESLDKKVNVTDKLETQQIKDGAITNEKMAAGSVGNTNLQDGSVSNEKLEDGSITNEKLAENSITKDKLKDNTIGVEKLDPELRQTINAATGLPKDLVETIQNVDDTLKDHQRQLDDKQSQIDDKQQQITANNDDISLLQTRSTQMEEAIKSIAATGGASQAAAVTYNNEKSKLTAVNIQSAVDEVVDKASIKDEEGTVVETPFRYIQNEEFIFAKVDAEDKLLFGFQWDGTPVFGKTSAVEDKLQSQVNLLADKIATILGDDDTTSAIDTLKELKDFFANIDNTQTLTSILANLNSVSTKLGEDIKNLQDTKVDKEEGKSLIEDEVKECFRIIENEEFLKAIVDSDDKVLFGFYRATGKPYYPLNDMYHVEQNEEFFALWLDADDKILLGIRKDGEIIGEIHAVNALKQVISQLQSDLASLQEKVGTIDTNLKELLDVFSLQENPEYMAVEKDADGKVLSATYNDGSHYIHNAKSETIPTEFSHIEDPEGRTEITTDAENKVMSYRDSSGKKHEHDMEVTNLDVSNINLQGNSVNNIQDALKANGFDVKTPIDWSESSFIQIPEPRFAIINVSNIDSMPTTKTQDKKAFLEFWDMQGNYFKKHAILNAQGNSSLAFDKKNVAIDLCDDEWIGDDTPKVRIGNWVPQDSFHMKAYYTDFFRGVGAVCYKLYDQIVQTRGNMYDRPWKKALLDMSKIDTTTKSLGNPYVGDYSLLTDTGARCFPDGFPVAVYLNGEFYGIFSFQLKKHRDNYHMNKSTAEHIHLDGSIGWSIIWDGTIQWGQGDDGFEVRNPKGLYAIGGNKYDADIKQEEIAGEEEVNAWIEAGKLPDGTIISSKIKKNLQMTAKVKKYIQDFSNTLLNIRAASDIYEASNKTEEDLKTFKKVFETYYDADNLIDYIIVSDVVRNYDGFWKNWQWFAYDGKKWWVGLYDCDCTFGNHPAGNQTGLPQTEHIDKTTASPTGFIVKYYSKELTDRYKYLAEHDIISSSNIFALIKDWCDRIGTNFYKEEYKKWKDSPCISDSVVRSDYWEIYTNDDGGLEKDENESFDATQSYNVGDVVSFGLNSTMGFFKYRCIKQTTALDGNTPHSVSAYSPIKQFKHCDNLYRIQKWIEQSVINMDKLYNYTRLN